MYEIFESLLKKYGVTTYQVAKATGISTASFTGWKQGKWNFKQDKLQKIADYFGVTVDYLITGNDSPDKKESLLTTKDERDISKILEQTRQQLLSQEGLMFDGDPASPEAIESILSAMQIGMELAKKKNKEKYTPKKYKKD
ncbi:helix-turn-helix domain-containing protein [Lactonifactor sp. BIOML-A3]|uniref:helix-turn-helix domain-containing protein n=1 Tax=unclassified Lactonifactor TaxID=2636670 RepID=UPI0012AF3137|nr:MULTISPECIES: helix-turn-helix transcriptional regulator [unclassified Lactonifactor]MSA01099.1 helix-turn-helix domain-containing protein [Lactonifactor sp. BIOML-A5]MSA09898.1 helix-turn-helix domain-containing protein [Lactonifactor sp. BIOML-A4]MSA13067.1 helix-turn-helix domain-containing protein [Lactonifactor sp. BIOML-A3]MSA18603.1 helix-turn-helix domain-containing protein [Lactonifactor sp. BIOML-A2]MSA38306.1 helix-turn-helix domain-containing protein [Lactonifactor sp. BIOML-A1]